MQFYPRKIKAFSRFAILYTGIALILAFNSEVELTPYSIQLPKGFTKMPVSADNPLMEETVELGRFLFYDPILSRDSTISCATCHQQEFAFADQGKIRSFGIDSLLSDRNTPPLFNLAWNSQLFWDGRANSIENQVFSPVNAHNEMDLDWNLAEERLNRSKFYKNQFKQSFNQERIDSVQISKAIAQFERTLISCNSRVDKVVRGEAKLTAEELRGHEVLNDQTLGNCLHCHTTDANLMGTTFKFADNGFQFAETKESYPDLGLGWYTEDINDNGKFKIPSLRNVALTAPYMHDGSMATLEEVIDFYSDSLKNSPNLDPHLKAHPNGMKLSESDKNSVISFLHCLTDSSFITNERFSNPFK